MLLSRLRRRVFAWMIAGALFSSGAHATSYDVLDVALLYPNAVPEELPNLLEVPWLAALLPTLMAQEYAGSVETQRVAVRTETADRECFADPNRWRLVAVRIDPWATLALGDVVRLDQRAQRNPQAQHRRVPQLRLTYQPFCLSGAARGVASDAAIHVIFNAYLEVAEAVAHRRLWQTLRDATAAGRRTDAEERYLAWISAPERDPSIRGLAGISFDLRRLREHFASSSEGLSRQFQRLLGLDGMIALTPDGYPDGALAHPLLHSPLAPAARLLADTIRRYGRPEALHQIRLMSTGDGELLWFFSILEPQGAAGLLRTVPVQIYTTEPLSAKPRLLADLGTYDFQALEATSAYARASRADQQVLSRQNLLGDVQAGRARAAAAWQRDLILTDPARSGHSTQSCFGCHESQERGTMALRVANGAAPREYGYFFRAFGYSGALPTANRRLIREAQATVRALQRLRP